MAIWSITNNGQWIFHKSNLIYVTYDQDKCYLWENEGWRESTIDEINSLSRTLDMNVFPEPSAPPFEEDSKELVEQVNKIQNNILNAMLEVDQEIRDGLFRKKGSILSPEEIDQKFIYMFKKILDPLLGKNGGLGFNYKVGFDSYGNIEVKFLKIDKGVDEENRWIIFASSGSVNTQDITSIAKGLQDLLDSATVNGNNLGSNLIDIQRLEAMGNSLSSAFTMVKQARDHMRLVYKDISNTKNTETYQRKILAICSVILSTGAVFFGLGIVGVNALVIGAAVLPWYIAGMICLASLAGLGIGGFFIYSTLTTGDLNVNIFNAYKFWSKTKSNLDSKLDSFLDKIHNDALQILQEVTKQMPHLERFDIETKYRNMLSDINDSAKPKKETVTNAILQLLEDGVIKCKKFDSIRDLQNVMNNANSKEPLLEAIKANLNTKNVNLEYFKEYQFLKQQSGNQKVNIFRLNALDFINKNSNQFKEAIDEVRDTMKINNIKTASQLLNHKFTETVTKVLNENKVQIVDLLNCIDFKRYTRYKSENQISQITR